MSEIRPIQIVFIFLFFEQIGLFTCDDTKIVGGINLGRAVPYFVSLRNSEVNHICGGSLISKRHVLTAAHCLINRSKMYAVVGTIRMDPDNAIYPISQLIIHPDYNSTTLKSDIGLAVTVVNVIGAKPIKYANIPLRNNVRLQIIGMGMTNFPGDFPATLQTLNVNVISNAECQEKLNRTIFYSNLCTLNEAGKGVCFGDSGGPLVYNKIVYGIASYGRPCALGFPDVYVRVFSHASWIRNQLK